MSANNVFSSATIGTRLNKAIDCAGVSADTNPAKDVAHVRATIEDELIFVADS